MLDLFTLEMDICQSSYFKIWINFWTVSNTKDYQKFIPFIVNSVDFNLKSGRENSNSFIKNVELSVGFKGLSESKKRYRLKSYTDLYLF